MRKSDRTFSVSSQWKADIANLDRAYLKFEANNQAFDLTFFQNEKGQSLRLIL